MSCESKLPVDRVSWRDGQLLTAQDVRDDQRRDRSLRELHTRYFHNTFGIGLGLEVTGVQQDVAVLVGPGYAITNTGREILLSHAMRIEVPAVAGPADFVLTISHAPDKLFRDNHAQAALCACDCLDPQGERPVFHWRTPEEVRFGPEVPLVMLTVAEAKIAGPLRFRVRRNARPLTHPYIVAGATDPGRTGWTSAGIPSSAFLSFLQVDVDTSEAGFMSTPFYFARVRTDYRDVTEIPSGAGSAPGHGIAFGLDALIFISVATSRNFTLRITQAPVLQAGLTAAPIVAERRGWIVEWVGIEPVSGCEPKIDPLRVFDRGGVNRAKL